MTSESTLDITLPSDNEILLTRRFDAPRELVWDCFTDPEKVRLWLGGGSLTVCEIDLRVGGEWRLVFEAGERGTIPLKGKFLEVTRPERFARTVCFDQPPRDQYSWTESVEFQADGNGTKLVSLTTHANREARDGQLEGMKYGTKSAYEKLDEVLAALQNK
ncbi:MAG TPA: SRPBCC domain-containing protein [Fimbriimonadaceae bacterium]|nr:SRPBCC domain-containing protein [Fimbriimonadaceae bacterium]